MEPNLMSGSLAVLSVTFNLALGLVLGASIGLERQWRQRHAGLATHALVAVGAAAFTSVPGLLPSVGDATRMGAQVVAGRGRGNRLHGPQGGHPRGTARRRAQLAAAHPRDGLDFHGSSGVRPWRTGHRPTPSCRLCGTHRDGAGADIGCAGGMDLVA